MVQRGLIGTIEEGRGDVTQVTFRFKPGKWTKLSTSPFVSRKRVFIPLSPKQRAVMERYAGAMRAANPHLQDFTIGYATVNAMPSLKKVSWSSFFPYGTVSTMRFVGTNPSGVGIGDAVHHAITEHLARKYSDFNIEHSHVTFERERQLRRMGIDPWKQYSMQEYRDKVRKYMKEKKGVKTEK